MNIGKNFLLTKRINLGEEFGGENAEDAYIVFTELETSETLVLRQGGDEAIEKMLDMLGKHIHEHNFCDELGQAIPNDKVLKMIKMKSVAAMRVIRDYSDWISDPFQKQKKPK